MKTKVGGRFSHNLERVGEKRSEKWRSHINLTFYIVEVFPFRQENDFPFCSLVRQWLFSLLWDLIWRNLLK